MKESEGVGGTGTLSRCANYTEGTDGRRINDLRLRHARIWVRVASMSSFLFAASRTGRVYGPWMAGLALASLGGLLLLLRPART